MQGGREKYLSVFCCCFLKLVRPCLWYKLCLYSSAFLSCCSMHVASPLLPDTALFCLGLTTNEHFLELDPQWPQKHHKDQKMSVLWYGRLSLQLLPRCNWICFISLSTMTLKLNSCSKFRTHFGFSSCLAKKLCLNNWRPSQRKMSSHKFRDDVVFPVIEYVLNGISYQVQKKRNTKYESLLPVWPAEPDLDLVSS